MNLKKLGRMFWVIAAVAMLAMVLQGCGGGNGNGGDDKLGSMRGLMLSFLKGKNSLTMEQANDEDWTTFRFGKSWKQRGRCRQKTRTAANLQAI